MSSRPSPSSHVDSRGARADRGQGGRFIQDLGNGLLLRQATPEDAEALVAFHSDMHREPGAEGPDVGIAASTRDMMKGSHPTFKAGDFTLVEDSSTGAIVSSMCLIAQSWTYGGIEFGVGRPELVGTHPDYRRRGLVRAQFKTIHQWSSQRGESLQAITGIPWYYRQFGYEMALALGGGRLGYGSHVPKLKDGEAEPYHVRLATRTDLPFITEAYQRGCRRSLVSCIRDEVLWQYELAGRSERCFDRRVLCIVETPTGRPVGFLAHSTALWRGRSAAISYELEPGISWLAVTPTVIRYLWARGQEHAVRDKKQTLATFAFLLGVEHPVYEAMHAQMPQTTKPYAWYVRVPDLLGFIRRVAPVLERRLASSVLVGHSGELKISRYRDGLHLSFKQGQLVSIDPWQPAGAEDGGAGFPDLTFLQLLFGYRSLEELKYAFPDCWTLNDEARALLEALFPKELSNVWGLA